MKNLQELLNKKGYNLTVDGIAGMKTLAATQLFIFDEIKKRGWFKPHTDLVYLRLDNNLTDTFDDVVVRFNKGVVDMVAPCSTTAGSYYFIHNIITYGGIKGCAIACEQQVLNSHRFVSGKSWANLWTGAPYFMQERPIDIFRDGNGDYQIDRSIKTNGLYGINFHRGWSGARIWNASAGCQVTPDKYWFELIKIFEVGNMYDLTLMEV